ncbi:AraC family transcriptional regulator [Kribbella sandramycini]|uniref:AraC family L-rhamnose operon transcriptional activator RhaR n=1 Tax=Kribbella sandramycini TaxID=60450 RepID=A0A7Y4NYG5_9ACTN|nr:AraC family transcriptional regulator [Kribbella sandramycini]MBB6569222.1 AraC family L-rhamnose operon transcriptional activator RhaR [Kribbella sandramycini]NOL40937.1 AraC family transcriptional regulator [Kribbella sandramycini]
MANEPMRTHGTLLHFVEGTIVHAGQHVHEGSHPLHTHSFFEIALVIAGDGVHHSQSGRQQLQPGDAILLRPGVWHEYEQCRGLLVYNCCFAADLVQRELAWTREDPLLGYLLWTGPFSAQRRGVLSMHLDDETFAEARRHLDGLRELRDQPIGRHRGELVGWLSLYLSCLARIVAERNDVRQQAHPAVLTAMRMLEADPARPWTLTELAQALHLAPGYLVRLFKSATGLPPMAYLSRHRAELAAGQLLHTDLPVSRIGEAVGWPDQNYFARRFKSHYGLSASNYRQRFNTPKYGPVGH